MISFPGYRRGKTFEKKTKKKRGWLSPSTTDQICRHCSCIILFRVGGAFQIRFFSFSTPQLDQRAMKIARDSTQKFKTLPLDGSHGWNFMVTWLPGFPLTRSPCVKRDDQGSRSGDRVCDLSSKRWLFFHYDARLKYYNRFIDKFRRSVRNGTVELVLFF